MAISESETTPPAPPSTPELAAARQVRFELNQNEVARTEAWRQNASLLGQLATRDALIATQERQATGFSRLLLALTRTTLTTFSLLARGLSIYEVSECHANRVHMPHHKQIDVGFLAANPATTGPQQYLYLSGLAMVRSQS